MSVALPVYQRGWVINSQLGTSEGRGGGSISKGMGDQFSAAHVACGAIRQYIKGDG